MDAKTLFRQGVDAIRDQNDLEAGRRLLIKSLKLDPSSDVAWLWLSRTYTDNPERRKQAVERALQINPDNAKAREILQRLHGSNPVGADGELKQPVKVVPAANGIPEPTPQRQQQIAQMLKKADVLLAQDQVEGAIEQWVMILNIQPDHELAMKNAVQHLVRLNYADDAKELVMRAVKAGSDHPSIYLTAIDFARKDDDTTAVDNLRTQLVQLPKVDESVVLKIATDYVKFLEHEKAHRILFNALENFPDSQKMLIMLGELSEKLGRKSEASIYYERAAKLNLRSKEGRAADKKLSKFAPVLTDKERGSVFLAGREAAGIGLFYLLLAWQDVGLDLAKLDSQHSLGVALGIIGGYLLITATSSPQQAPIAALLGGKVPQKSDLPRTVVVMGSNSGALSEPTELPIIPEFVRYILGGVGVLLLLAAFWLTFQTAIGLLLDPVAPDLSDMYRLFYGDF